ncbi:MAG: hypothetical protein LBI35_06985 [Burkholderiales bacterium]|nr:hypothetical protein [Burkholderiales bacterium]
MILEPISKPFLQRSAIASGAISAKVVFSGVLSGLSPGTAYRLYLLAQNGDAYSVLAWPFTTVGQ